MRASTAAAAAIPAALGLMLAVAGRTGAQAGPAECQAAFEKWAQMSGANVRPVQDAGGRGACIPSEAARENLLEALARTRALCGDSSEASTQPVRTLISINQSFIGSLSVCRTEGADTGEGWSVKTAPTEKPPPKIAAPAPLATPPPVTGGPRPSVIAPPPKTGADTAAPKPPCLEVAANQGDVYSLINRHCKGHSVLAVIETRAASGETACKGYTIGVGLNLKGPSAPRINYECVTGAGGCNKDRLGDMFPECDW
jgi:hypothetical protein